MRDILVYSRPCGDECILRIGFFDKPEVRAIKAPMVARVKNVIAVILGVLLDVFETCVGGVARKKAPSLTKNCLDDEARVMKLACFGGCNALDRTDYFELHSILRSSHSNLRNDVHTGYKSGNQCCTHCPKGN